MNLGSLSEDDLTKIASPLIDKVMASGRVTITTIKADPGTGAVKYNRANAMFFLVSVRPNILVVTPYPPKDTQSAGPPDVGQSELGDKVEAFLQSTGAWDIVNAIINQHCASLDARMLDRDKDCYAGKRQSIMNPVILSRVFLERDGTLMIDADMKTPAPLTETFRSGRHRFEVSHVNNFADYRAIRVLN